MFFPAIFFVIADILKFEIKHTDKVSTHLQHQCEVPLQFINNFEHKTFVMVRICLPLVRVGKYNNQSCSKMWYGTIPPKGSHFLVRYKACPASDDRKCEPEGGIVQSHIFDHGWFFSHISRTNIKSYKHGRQDTKIRSLKLGNLVQNEKHSKNRLQTRPVSPIF